MKKLTLLSLVSTLACSSLTYADCMGGGCSANAMKGGAPFFALEGGFANNSFDGYNFTLSPALGTITSSEDKQNYLARISAGMIMSIEEQFAVSGELGWGYYGKTTLTPVFVSYTGPVFVPGSLNTSYELSGFDALVGMLYTQPSFSLYFKAGALLENMKIKTNANFVSFNVADRMQYTSTQTGVLPEVKVGGAYNFNENWALTLSLMYAFGSSPGVTGDFNTVTTNSSLVVKNSNPTVGGVMIGIQATI
ncbi:MAG: hypothetical protein EPN84_07760 [Legionella sp.]|nr:MAG: hypothetical protein EPN84_07760 [Legionella sp.]